MKKRSIIITILEATTSAAQNIPLNINPSKNEYIKLSEVLYKFDFIVRKETSTIAEQNNITAHSCVTVLVYEIIAVKFAKVGSG